MTDRKIVRSFFKGGPYRRQAVQSRTYTGESPVRFCNVRGFAVFYMKSVDSSCKRRYTIN